MRMSSCTKRCEWTSRTLFITLRLQATSSKVFVLPPWKAIYVNDAERDHTFEHAESVNSITQEWYRRCRYQLIEVPRFRLQSGVRMCCKRWQTATPNKSRRYGVWNDRLVMHNSTPF